MSDSSASCCSIGNPSSDVENSLAGFFGNLFETSSYPARWNCGSWTPIEGWLHIVSDIGIFAAYFAIPLALVYFVLKRRDRPFFGVFILFAAFIMLCGTSHLIEAIIFYYPIYRVAGLVKLATMMVSWATLIVLIRLMPLALDLPSIAAMNQQYRTANEAKGNFLANMSHELRTPMTSILGYSDVFLEAEDTETRTDAAESIKRNGEHLLRILNDILDLSKIDAGKMSIESVVTSVRNIVDDVEELEQAAAEKNRVSIVTLVDHSVPQILKTDPVRLRQILHNLVGNAVKFTSEGIVNVRISHEANANQPTLVIRVKDTGIGMSQDQLKNLFQPFTQADSSTTRKFGGTGLGLAITKKLVELLNGTIKVESQPDCGTTFQVTIPYGIVQNDKKSKSSKTVYPKFDVTSYPGSNEKLHILVGEDGPDNQRLIRLLLKNAGMGVEIYDSGLAVLEAYNKAPDSYDIVLMDVQMPVMDGYQATKELRWAGCALPIIALTAHAMAGDREKCLSSGCDDYMTKPFNGRKMVELIRNTYALSVSSQHLRCEIRRQGFISANS
ncbi:ATP-binding protein [uncultured Rubinisphaera sp.]|uniref:ATP-binding protein n=1 Tax=uncultured Rubinisphaera sp. TaxID=1678686 RepID=UPI0030D72E67